MVKEKQEIKIEDLPGVGPTTAEKFYAAGIDSPLAVAVTSIGRIVELSGVSEGVARKMVQASRELLDIGFESGEEISKKREKIERIKTGVEAFDNMLDGGFECGCITEVFGEFGCGKTQIGHQLAVNCQESKDKGGLDGKVIYIDSENTFRPERIIEMAEGAGLDPTKILKNIKIKNVFNTDEQMYFCEAAEKLLKEDPSYKLLIVDSLTSHFRVEFGGRGELSGRQQKLNKHMNTLRKLASTYSICVLVTNQVMAKPNVMFGDPTQAIGGHIVGHNSTFRIYLRKGPNGKKGGRTALLIDSPNLPDGEAPYYVTTNGLREKEEKKKA